MTRRPDPRAQARARAKRAFEAQPPGQRLGDGPVDADIADKMTVIMGLMDEFLNGPKDRPDYVKRHGVVIMMFPFEGFDGRCNYMSNGADRRDIVTLMREMIARFEGQPEIEGRA